jgi:N-acetylglucosaminyldiphosphoundecaprenol N-acetyl-beta-D-mannosaminyltransferase
MEKLPSLMVFKTRVCLGTFDDILTIIRETKSAGQKVSIDTSNTVVVSLAAINGKFREALETFDILFSDSMPLVWYLRLLGSRIKTTCYAPEATLRIWDRFSGNSKIMVVGSDDKTRALFESKFNKPAAWVTSRIDPDNPAAVSQLIRQVNSVDPDILFLALGCPKSYYMLQKIKAQIKRGAIIHVGGSFDIVSGRKRITPAKFQKLGLGWLFRLTQEPGRLTKRYMIFNTLFILCVFRYFLKNRRQAADS